jgi:hypothetical protein
MVLDRIVIRVINAFDGNMDFVRKHLYELAVEHMQELNPHRERVMQLEQKLAELVSHYNSRVEYYNQLVSNVHDKRHEETQAFIARMKSKIREILSDVTIN